MTWTRTEMINQEYLDLKCIMKGQHEYELYIKLKNNHIKTKTSEWYELYSAFECTTCGYITEPKYNSRLGTYSTPDRNGDTLTRLFPKKSK